MQPAACTAFARYVRPSGWVSSWYFAASRVIASSSSSANASRSRGERKRICMSVESVGRGLPAFSAIAWASPTSCAMREARAIK